MYIFRYIFDKESTNLYKRQLMYLLYHKLFSYLYMIIQTYVQLQSHTSMIGISGC